MQEFVIKGNPKEIMDQLEDMKNEEDRLVFEKRQEEAEQADKSYQDEK